MPSTTNKGRQLGLLFLATFIAGATGTISRGFTGADTTTTEFLVQVVENTDQMKIAIALDMVASAIGVFITIFLFPRIQKMSRQLAIAYVGVAMINFVIITMSNVVHVALLSIASDFNTSDLENVAHLVTLAKMHYDMYYWIHFLMLMLYSIGGAMLYFFLYRTALVRRWLALWGLCATTIVFVGGALQISDIAVPFWFFLQNGIFMLVFIGYLIAVGFRKKEATLKTENNGV